MKPHIIIIAAHFHPRISGYAVASTNFIRALDQFGAGVTFTVLANDACPSPASELEIKNGAILRLPIPQWLPYAMGMFVNEIRLYFAARRITKRNESCLILFETMERSIALYLLAHSPLNDRIALRLHGTTETEYFIWGRRLQLAFRGFLTRCAAKRIRTIFSTTDYYCDFYRKWFLRENPLVAARCNFFIIENIAFNPDDKNVVQDEILLKYGVKNDAFFLSLGRLDNDGMLQKGFQDLVAAMYWLRSFNRSLPPDFKLLLIGDGPCREMISQHACELGVNEWISLIPSAKNEEIRVLQACSAAVVLVSRFDGLSMFVLESLAAGSPLILSAFGGLQGLVESGKNGFLAPPQNIPAIAGALFRIASLSPEGREQMRHFSRNIYEERFLPSTIIKKFLTAVNICSPCAEHASERSSGPSANDGAALPRGLH
jgi:glycosyltransferase involved in cell wall biosynthesis